MKMVLDVRILQVSVSSKYVGSICQLQMQGRQQSGNNKVTDVDDLIFHEHIGVLGNICKSDHCICKPGRCENSILNLSMVDEENKLYVCKHVDHNMWLTCTVASVKQVMNSSGKKLDHIKILKLTNVLNFICSSPIVSQIDCGR